MRRALRASILATAALFATVAPAHGDIPFGLTGFDTTYTNAGGSSDFQAGSHPFAMTTSLRFNSAPTGLGGEETEEQAKDILTYQVPGFVGAPTSVPTCSNASFLTSSENLHHELKPDCPDSSTIGVSEVTLSSEIGASPIFSSVYNLPPPPGKAAKIGFWVANVPVPIELGLSEAAPYDVLGGPTNISQLVEVLGAKLTLWGVPGDPAHDGERGRCLGVHDESLGSCPAPSGVHPFLTLPRACRGPLATSWAADSWQHPGAKLANGTPDLSDPNWLSGSVLTHDEAEPPAPRGFSLCGRLGFNPAITARPTSKAASSPTGLDFSLNVNDEGITNPSYEAVADSDIEKVEVTLPEGMSANPSLAEGLSVCSEAQLEAESAFSEAGTGCPGASKIGTVEVETPVLEEKIIKGALYIAKPYENPFHTLLALYVVLQNRELGISVKQPLKVEPDPVTGQLTTVAEELPQLPFSHFRLHFREGGRSPLISPPTCGTHNVKAVLYPWSGNPPITTFSAFQIISGPNEGPCPPGGVQPFHPGFEAGSVNNNAGSYSPFDMRLTRKDGEQDMTKFSAVLPPGVVGKIAGVAKCPEAQIAQAKSRTGPHGGQEELDHPSCPASSKIGRTLAGAGVGSQLTYVPGSLYLAGPIGGDPLSVVSITPALAGPFDAGAVVVRVALTLNSATAEVEADGSHSDPIPHILKGIPLNVRDLRVYADKANFTINPTNCEPSSARATLFGSFLNPLDPADDVPVGLSTRYQAANCAALGFKPNLAINLIGGTKRGGHPALTATVTPRPGDANFKSAVVTLPHSAFLDQAHIRTICTRVQFAAGAGNGSACPPDSIYGHAKANSPLLEETLEGPVFLRSSSHNLPDLVVALHGIVDINLASRIDSQKGGIRSTFESIPDAPVSKFVLEMQGAKKGLIVNSTNLCKSTNRAKARIGGQNGKVYESKPALQAKCKGARKAKRHHHRHARRAALHHLRAAR